MVIQNKDPSPTWMSKSSELTSIELKKLAVGQVDLAAGYPNLKLPNWIERIYNDRIGQEYSEEFSWPVGKLRDIRPASQ
jgi:hypothetical protein